jgi:hypothetical protein
MDFFKRFSICDLDYRKKSVFITKLQNSSAESVKLAVLENSSGWKKNVRKQIGISGRHLARSTLRVSALHAEHNGAAS